MDTSSMTFCPFSPLRTPQGKKKKKIATAEESDVDSVIRGIANSVQKRLSSDCEQTSDDDIFLTQAFPEDQKAPKQGKENKLYDSAVTFDLSENEFTNTQNISPSKKKSEEKLQATPRKLNNSSKFEKSSEKQVDPCVAVSLSQKRKPSSKTDSLNSFSLSSVVDTDGSSEILKNFKSPKKRAKVTSTKQPGSQPMTIIKENSSSTHLKKTQSPKKPIDWLSKSFARSPVTAIWSNSKGKDTAMKKSHTMSDSESSDASLSSGDEDSPQDKSKNSVKEKAQTKSMINIDNGDSDSSAMNANNTSLKKTITEKNKSSPKKTVNSNSNKKVNLSFPSSDSDGSSIESDSDNDKQKTKSTGKSSSTQKKSGKANELKKTSDDESDSSISMSDLDPDREEEKGSKTNKTVSPLKKQAVNNDSDSSSLGSGSDSDMSVKKGATKVKSPAKTSAKTLESMETSGEQLHDAGAALRYKIPEKYRVNYELDNLCVRQSDIKGKQLWLIHAPASFDMTCLNQQKINLSEPTVLTAQETDQQYEVITRNFTANEKEKSYRSVALKSSHSLSVGAGMCGEMYITDWIPDMPPVTLNKTKHVKHTVPDNLQSSYTLFGSSSPERHECLDDVDSSRKSKKKKKKYQEMVTMETEQSLNNSSVEASTMVTESENNSKTTKKKKKHKHSDTDAVTMETENKDIPNVENSLETETSDVSTNKKKKKKKSKHGESVTMETEHSVDISNAAGDGLTETRDASSSKKFKKKKKRKHADSVSVEVESSMDTIADVNTKPVAADEDCIGSSKKAKKKKKSKLKDNDL